MKFFGFGLSLLTLALPLGSSAASAHLARRASHHHDIAKRADGDVQLFKRFSATRWTFYDVGLGACGKHNVPSDFIVALNSAQFGGGYPGPNCFKMITMRYNGKTARAQIMDECPGCPFGGLDLSRGLFRFFAAESVGVLSGDWSFDGDGDDDPSPPPPKTTHHEEPKPTTTHKPETTKTTPKHTPTTTEKPEPTTRSSTKSSSSSSSAASSSASASSTVTLLSTSVDFSKGPASGLANPTGIIETGDNIPQNLHQINLALVSMAAVVVAGAEVN